jgi:hypothetical protein
VLTFSLVAVLLGGAGAIFYFALAWGDEKASAHSSAAEEAPAPFVAEGASTLPEVAPAPSLQAAAPKPERSAELQNFVDAMVIAGIRTSDTGNRAIINGRMHGVGDKLPPSMELTLVNVQPRRLTFRDQHGFTYQRSF